jgi:hypothetical protein
VSWLGLGKIHWGGYDSVLLMLVTNIKTLGAYRKVVQLIL